MYRHVAILTYVWGWAKFFVVSTMVQSANWLPLWGETSLSCWAELIYVQQPKGGVGEMGSIERLWDIKRSFASLRMTIVFAQNDVPSAMIVELSVCVSGWIIIFLKLEFKDVCNF